MRDLRFIIVAAAAALLLVSCKDDEKIYYYQSAVTIDESALNGAPSPDSYDITFTNSSTGYVRTAKSTGTTARVDSLVVGFYDVTVQSQFSYAGYAYNYIGTAKNVECTNEGINCTIPVSATKAQALVIKEVYYNHCKDNNSANYLRDCFIEIYNNSDQTVYADGIAVAMTLSPNTFEWKYDTDVTYNGNTYDTVGIQDDDKYIFVGMTVWQIPGAGKTYPVDSGESIVLAAYAMDHTENASASLDLSTADFEFYCDHYGEKGQSDCNAINLNLVAAVSAPTNQFMLTVTGRGFIIFHQDTPIRSTDFIRSSNYPTSLGLEVLKTDVIDAVDLVANATTKKWVDEEFDAGKVLSQGNYCGKSVLRKVKEAINGRVILQDTNNSTEDFIYCTDASIDASEQKPVIRRFGAGRPSWSTWTTAQ